MSKFLGYLERLKVRPDPDMLSAAERSNLQQNFDPRAAEVTVNGRTIDWDRIDEVEVVPAARSKGPSGWLVRQVMGADRYHVGIYYGQHEEVLINVPLKVAEYVVRSIAFYAPNPIRYKGIEGLSPLAFS